MTLTALQSIDHLVGRINTHPEYSGNLRQEMMRVFRDEAVCHSISLEMQEKVTLSDMPSNNEIQENMERARAVLGRMGICMGSLAQLGYIIDPQFHAYANFRRENVRFGEFDAPHYEDVPRLVRNLVSFLDTASAHPVLRAVEAHIEIVRIHPYLDGNGRAARLLQNSCLEQRGYAPAIIPAAEREIYIALLNRTLRDRYAQRSSFEAPSEDEEVLRKFLTSKVLESVVRLDEALAKRRMYTVQLTRVTDKGSVYAVAKQLRQYNAGRNSHGISVSVNVTGRNAHLEIIGDISSSELDARVKKAAGKYTMPYSIVSKT